MFSGDFVSDAFLPPVDTLSLSLTQTALFLPLKAGRLRVVLRHVLMENAMVQCCGLRRVQQYLRAM